MADIKLGQLKRLIDGKSNINIYPKYYSID